MVHWAFSFYFRCFFFLVWMSQWHLTHANIWYKHSIYITHSLGSKSKFYLFHSLCFLVLSVVVAVDAWFFRNCSLLLFFFVYSSLILCVNGFVYMWVTVLLLFWCYFCRRHRHYNPAIMCAYEIRCIYNVPFITTFYMHTCTRKMCLSYAHHPYIWHEEPCRVRLGFEYDF